MKVNKVDTGSCLSSPLPFEVLEPTDLVDDHVVDDVSVVYSDGKQRLHAHSLETLEPGARETGQLVQEFHHPILGVAQCFPWLVRVEGFAHLFVEHDLDLVTLSMWIRGKLS